MEIKQNIDSKKYDIGVLIVRFQVDNLHIGHRELIDHVLFNHKKVIIFLGVARIQNTQKNPLDFATRCAMIREVYPTSNIIILPLNDQRDNKVWSKTLDEKIKEPFGDKPAILYGSRDSFIPYYSGKYQTVQLEPTIEANATEIREEISKEIKSTADFRRGIIHSIYAQRPVSYPTVDVVIVNDKGQILLGKKPNESMFRFIGGFVDVTDKSYEDAAKRELSEETGGNLNARDFKYILSHKVDDWRYKNERSKIMTTLYMGTYASGYAKASDDIEQVDWIDANLFSNNDGVMRLIMPEHREMMKTFIQKAYDENLIPNLGSKLDELENVKYFN